MGIFRRRAGKLGVLAALGIAGLAIAVTIAYSTSDERTAQAAESQLVTEVPRRDLPRVLDGVVLESAQVGDFIVVGGNFSQVELADGTIEDVTSAFAYNIDTGEFAHQFTPLLARASGADPEVLAVEPGDNNTVFLGGRFGTVDGHPHNSLTKINISTGTVETALNAQVEGDIREIVLSNGRLFVGGDFNAINGADRQNLAELNPINGAVQPFRADITDSSRPEGITFGPRNLSVTPSNILVVAHRGTTVAGLDRPGLTLINLNNNQVLPWRTDFFDDIEIRTIDADVSPDGTLAVLVANGGDFPFLGRDAAVAFDISATAATVSQPVWIARNFDSTYSVAITDGGLTYAATKNR